MKKNKISKDDILAEVRYQASQASGSEFASDELIEDRTNALKYYMGKPRGDEIEGNSTAISMDVADMIDALLTQLMPMFKSDDLVSFEASSEQDEQQARTESKFCNHTIMQRNNGFILFETLLKDALLSKNATSKVRVDVKEDITKERYKDLSKEEMFMVLQPKQKNERLDITLLDEDAGKINLKRIVTTRKLIVEAMAPENFSITSEHKSPYLDDCVYCNERRYVSRSDLVEEGYDKKVVANLPSTTTDTKADSVERNTINDEQNYYNREASMQICEVFDHYIRIDADGDGIAELHKVVTCENILLGDEEAPCIPYANGIVFLMGHRFYGQSVYDKLKDIQDSKTQFLRQWETNALINNHSKTDVVEDQVNMDDFLNGRANGVRRVESLDSCREVVTPDIGPSCKMALDYFDKVRTDRTGSSLDLQANTPQMPSNVGDQGVNTLVANLEKVSALVAKNFCETLVYSTYSLVHKYLRLYFPEELNAKMHGQWQATNPSQWLERDTISIVVPATNSEKLAEQVAIEKAIIMAQGEIQNGQDGITTSQDNIYQMKLDYMKLAGIDNPSKYMVNPASPGAQQAIQQKHQASQQEKQMMMQQQQQMQAKQDAMQLRMLETQIAEIQRNWESDIKDREFDYVELNRKLEMDKYKADLDADMDEAKLMGDATLKLKTIELEKESAVNEPTTTDTQDS